MGKGGADGDVSIIGHKPYPSPSGRNSRPCRADGLNGPPFPGALLPRAGMRHAGGVGPPIPFWGLGFLASAKVPVAIFFVAWLSVILLYAWILNRRNWLTLPSFLFFGVGWYIHNAVQAAVIVSIPGKNPIRALITAVVDGLILFLLLRQIRRSGLQTESDCQRTLVGL